METINIIKKEGWDCEQLWKGCMLAAIAHAIMVTHYPELSHEHSWDGVNYNVQDSSGGRGTVTFFANSCVAAFNSHTSERYKDRSVNFFENAPQVIQELAMNETLQYLLEDVQGVPTPIVTSAFWGIKDQLFSSDEFKQMLDHGGFLLVRQAMDYESAVASWSEYYEMNSDQENLLRSVYKRKLEEPNKPIILQNEEIMAIGPSDSEGIEESKESFEEIGVYWA